MKRQFWLQNVFAGKTAAAPGNQLAVVFDDEAILNDEQMQRITRDFNFSETIFIAKKNAGGEFPEGGFPVEGHPEGGFPVRIFTPGEELRFAGHPMLGAAATLFAEGVAKGKELHLLTKAGPIKVQQEGELLFMHQNPAEFGAELSHEKAAHFLGLSAADLQPQLPVQQVSTGTPFWLCALKSVQALAEINFQADKWLNFVQQHEGKALLVYTADATDEQLLHVRVFTHYYNIPEDPATGSANGCLCGYLARYSYPNQPFERRVQQGKQMGRAAELHLRFSTSSGSEGIWVGGRSKLFARGELCL